jgi:3-isopropylmalate/(R)-2-methylmalate dehydratase small subunit
VEPLRIFEAVALPIPRVNVDTDQIIPARFLRKPRAGGFGQYLFYDLRYRPDGSEDAAFVLNRAPYRNARIVVAGANFGCGSSRENAVWALHDFGFRVVIAPSFGDIFVGNCLQNGMLAVRLPDGVVRPAMDAIAAAPGSQVAVDLDAQTVTLPGSGTCRFEIDPFSRHCLLNGVDELGYTLAHTAEIEAFEARCRQQVSRGAP